ncbi:MAG: hypothetical protein WBQ25_06520 [Nitrososphaeraceae archaeon]
MHSVNKRWFESYQHGSATKETRLVLLLFLKFLSLPHNQLGFSLIQAGMIFAHIFIIQSVDKIVTLPSDSVHGK